MLIHTDVLLSEIGATIMQTAPDGWEKLVVVARGWGNVTDVTAWAFMDDSSEMTFRLDKRSIAVTKLRKAMYKPSAGTWYVARFTIDSSHQLDTEFEYSIPPYEDDELDEDMRNILCQDQKKYPRDPEHLPSWHPEAP